MNLNAVSVNWYQTGEPLVISSAQFSSALVTGVPHISNNAMLSHSTHSKLAKSENYTAEHSTRRTQHHYKACMTSHSEDEKCSLQSSVVVSEKHPPQQWRSGSSRVSHIRLMFTINTFFVLGLRHYCIWDCNECGHKMCLVTLLLHDISWIFYTIFLFWMNMQPEEIKFLCTYKSWQGGQELYSSWLEMHKQYMPYCMQPPGMN